MCEPVSISLAITAAVVSIASSTANAVMQAQQAKAQKASAKAAANLKRDQIASKHSQAAEASGNKMFELARQAQIAKGAVSAQGLSDRSVAAIGRSIGFELGQDKATLKRNQEIAAEHVGAQLHGIDLELVSQKQQIGDTSGVKLGFQVAGGVASGINTGLSLGNALGGFGGETKFDANSSARTSDAASGGHGSMTGF